MRSFILAWIFLFVASPDPVNLNGTYPETGKVTRIIDGDTFDLLTKNKKLIRVRMHGIDSPERKQDYYRAAKDALGALIFQKQVKLSISGRDRNKRAIAMVYRNGENINLAMIGRGFAWHYREYSADTAFANAERKARLGKMGLWKMAAPVPPWEFRRLKRRTPASKLVIANGAAVN